MAIAIFGDFASVPVPGIQFVQIMPGDRRLPGSPRFTFGDLPGQVLASYYRYTNLHNIGIFVAHDIALAADCLLLRDQTCFQCPQLNIHPVHIETALDQVGRAGGTLRRRDLPGQYAVITGPGYRIYGHWLIDFLPKLYLLHAAGYVLRDLDYLIPDDTPEWALSWLELLGISRDRLSTYSPLTEAVFADELLLPTIVHNGARVSPVLKDAIDLAHSIIELAHGRAKRAPSNRVFISRKYASQSRPLRNRQRIEEMAAEAGFKLIHPEQLTPAEQVTQLMHVSHIVGEYGSGMHNSMFARAGTVVCALRGSDLHPGFLQSGIAEVLGQHTGYVFGTSEQDGSFVVSEDAFRDCLTSALDGTAL